MLGDSTSQAAGAPRYRDGSAALFRQLLAFDVKLTAMVESYRCYYLQYAFIYNAITYQNLFSTKMQQCQTIMLLSSLYI